MASFNRCEQGNCEKAGTQSTRLIKEELFCCNKKSCSAGKSYFLQRRSFSTSSRSDLKYQFANKHSAPKLDVIFECKYFYEKVLCFYISGQGTNSQHSYVPGKKVDTDDIISEVDHTNRFWNCVPVKNFSWSTRLEGLDAQ